MANFRAVVEPALIVEAVATIAERAEDWNEEVRLVAVEALARAAEEGNALAYDTITARIKDHEPAVRAAAAAALASLVTSERPEVNTQVAFQIYTHPPWLPTAARRIPGIM